MRIDLAKALSDLSEIQQEVGEDRVKVNPILLELDKPEVATAILALILNEIRLYRTSGITLTSGGVSQTKTYDVNAGFAKLSAYAELLDIPKFIEAKKVEPTEPDDDRLPEVK